MTSTITKISTLAVFVTVAFGVFGFMSDSQLFINEASAQTSCGSCGDNDGGGGNNDGGGGNQDTPPPVCDIDTNLRMVNVGQTYRISWTGTTGATYSLVNDSSATPVDPIGWYEFTWNANDVMVMYELRGQNAGGSCSDIVEVFRSVPAPTCDISTNIATVQSGSDFTITWAGTPSHSTVFRVNNTIVAAEDSMTYPFPVGRTTPIVFTFTAQNAGGTCSDAVTVYPASNPPVTPIIPVCTLNIAADSIVRGNSTQLTWTTTNAATAVINPGSQSVNPSNTVGAVGFSVSPQNTITYTMTVTSATNHTASCSDSVTVTTPPSTPAPVCDLNASAASIVRGESVSLTWTSSNATRATILGVNGTYDTTLSRTAASPLVVSPTQTFTYILTVYGANNQSQECPVTVTVTNPPNPAVFSCENNVTLSANPSSIRRGNSSTITWTTTGVTSLSFNNGITSTALNDSVSVSPTNSTTYTMTISNGSQTRTCSVPVTVTTTSGGGGGGGTPTPRCELTASTKSVSSGGRVTLEWDTTNATDVVIKDSHGKTIVTTAGKLSREKRDLYDGKIVVNPTKKTTYTLTASRGSRDRDCKVVVDVKNGVVVIENRDQQPVVTGIALTQVPYTGFEAGPFVTMMFYLLLGLFAAYLAYVYMIRRTPVVAAETIHTATSVDMNPAVFATAPAPVPTFHTAMSAAPATIGYDAAVASDEVTALENQAHAGQVLLSADAMRYFMTSTEGMNRSDIMAAAIEHAKGSYPSEDGWVVINEDRMKAVCVACVATTAPSSSAPFVPTTLPTGHGSLAEAIVTGNIVAAYQLIGNRPMIALADAAAELDALYRHQNGEVVSVSELLASQTVTTEQLHAAIAALTGAIDGTYTDEAEAVKMAILKATKALQN